ncbi:hypothetical protein [Amphritea sp. HPY]|uniref:hypothetical protein n=1 Tax=Amphritea sp. HPY TaxID=3421652 RepID=UPI003D7EE1B1
MRVMLAILLMSLAPPSMAVSKQDIQNCQKLGKTELVSQCVRLLKSNTQRRQKIACKQDLRCWAELNQTNAQNNCAAAFNRASQRDQRWASIWDNQKLSHARWLSKKSASLTYYTDKDSIRLECRFNPNFPGKAKIGYMKSTGGKSGINLDR